MKTMTIVSTGVIALTLATTALAYPEEDYQTYSNATMEPTQLRPYAMQNPGYNARYGYHTQGRYRVARVHHREAPYHPAYTFSEQIPAPGRKTFIFDPNILSWAAYDADGSLVKTGRASGGRSYCPDIHRGCKTPIGTFAVQSKGGPGCISSKFPIGKGGAPMPYCMYFHGGYAIHGSYEVPNHNASHGCIRVHPEDAEWLSYNFIQPGTKVIVKSY